jgi:hypothetical protein
MATCAQIVGTTLPDNAGEDSVSLLPLFSDPSKSIRRHVVLHSAAGKFAIRDERWKLVLCPGSGGWSHNDAQAAEKGLPLVQLYDMHADPGETTNLYLQHPQRVKQMLKVLEEMIANGRSTPGSPQSNDAEVDIWKLSTMPTASRQSLDDYR